MISTLIRLADDDDLPELPALEASAAHLFARIPGLEGLAGTTTTTLESLQRIQGDGQIWVAQGLEDPWFGELVAMACALRFGADLHIEELSVRADAQGRGLGRAVLAAMLEAALDDGCTGATLTTFRDVPWNGPFYASMGFREVSGTDLPAHLKAALEAEAARGILPMDRRCAMRLALG
jgi:GNAT superfamily N-acetyltransferase